ncbi:MAG TPA: GlcNAc transferase [Planctomycetaceae bacterium]|nr:GlcNAc transferase [Planctomycetaceae bacterium]
MPDRCRSRIARYLWFVWIFEAVVSGTLVRADPRRHNLAFYRVPEVKVIRSAQRASHVACVAGIAALCSTGCSSQSFSVASLNPFSKAGDKVAAAPAETPSQPGQLASMRQAVTGQANSLSTATSSAWNKTKNGVTGLFGGSESTVAADGTKLPDNDPTRLSTPASVSPEVFVAQGALWETTGDFTKAMDSYNRAVQAEPNNAAALASVARLQLRQQNFPQASESFEKALKVSPKDSALLNDYGMTRAKMGDTAGADRAISEALTISPGTSRFANNLANIRFDAGNQEGAMQVLLQHNKPAVAHFNMAYMQYQSGNYAEAKNQLSEVLKYEPAASHDSAVAQAVSRSRDMLTTIDAGATRIAQAGSGVMASANQISSAFAGQPTAQPSQVVPSSAGTWTEPTTAPASGSPAAPPAGGFALPPGVFDQTIR